MISQQVLSFYQELNLPESIGDVQVMNPYQSEVAMELTSAFYRKYYSDNNPRKLIFGINPGRFGGGITGIPFTDPVNLQEKCGIDNDLDKRHELSSRFIYYMIDALGGPEKFYGDSFIGAVSPLGFTRDGKNINYYDDKDLQDYLHKFIIECLKTQLKLCGNPSTVYCLGQGKNIKYLNWLNSKEQLFEEVIPLPHPRWVMQYRLKRIDEFVDEYQQKLG